MEGATSLVGDRDGLSLSPQQMPRRIPLSLSCTLFLALLIASGPRNDKITKILGKQPYVSSLSRAGSSAAIAANFS